MRLLSLELENIRSYGKLKLEFPSGSMLFRGDMGSGKSTILMAIEFALFGSGSLMRDMVSKKEQKGEIVLCFDVDGNTYEIGRVIDVKSSGPAQSSRDSYIKVDGQKEPLSVTDLKARVLQILGFNENTNPRANSQVYRYAVYVPQEEIKSIIENRDREEIIRRAFGMEDYATSIDNIKQVVKKIKHANASTAVRFEGLDGYRTSLQERRSALYTLKNDITTHRTTESNLLSDKDDVQRNMKYLRQKLDDLIVLKTESSQLQSTIHTHNTQYAQYRNDMDRLESDIFKLDKDIAEHTSIEQPTTMSAQNIADMLQDAKKREAAYMVAAAEAENVQRDIQTIQNRLQGRTASEIAGMISSLQSNIESARQGQSDAEEELAGIHQRLGALVNESNNIQESLRRASTLGSRCDVCNSELDPAHVSGLKASRQAKLDKTKDDIAKSRERQDTLKSQISATAKQIQLDGESLDKYKVLERDTGQMEALKSRLEDIRNDILPVSPEEWTIEGFSMVSGESASAYLGRLSNALSDYNHSMDVLAEKHKRKSTLEINLDNIKKLYEETAQKIESEKKRLDDINSQISTSGDMREKYNRMDRRRSDIENNLKDIAKTIAALNERIASINNDIDTLESNIKTAERHKAIHDMREDSMDWLEQYYINSVAEIEKGVRESLRYDFDQFYGEWYSMLVDDFTKTSMIDGGFGPVLYQDGYGMDVSGLSGGEKTSVALAYRLALNSTIRRMTNTLKSNLLILDEPTDGFSRQQMEKMRTILEHLRCEQVIMVSHEVEMEGYVDHVFRVTKTEGASSIQKM